jgi:hypothetical protein
MGVIHVRNKRYAEGVACFQSSIEKVVEELDKYKMKYTSCGLREDELLIDNEFQKMSTITLNRCFNLGELLS